MLPWLGSRPPFELAQLAQNATPKTLDQAAIARSMAGA
jgi:hypothetical protein